MKKVVYFQLWLLQQYAAAVVYLHNQTLKLLKENNSPKKSGLK